MLKRRDFLASSALAAAAAGPWGPSRAQSGGTDYDVLIIGAGVAGLAAAATLLRLDEELKVLVLEGRDRIGGRVHSVPQKGVVADVELGARFLQHPAGADWEVLRGLNLLVEADSEGRLRLLPGMSSLVERLAGASEGFVQLSSTVTEVLWRQGIVGVYYRNRGLESAVTARRIISTVPTPLLLAETPRFTPQLPLEKQAALLELPLQPQICTGMRLPAAALQLDEAAREISNEIGEFSLRRVPETGQWIVEARYAGGRADALSGQPQELLQAMVLRDLGRSLDQPLTGTQPLWALTDDWLADPLSLGALAPAADASVHAALIAPLEDTLFFAGDAAIGPEVAGTVHGAYASGQRAGEAVARSLGVGATPEATAGGSPG